MPFPMLMMKFTGRDSSAKRSGSTEISSIGVAAFVVCIAAGGLATALFNQPAPIIVGAAVGLFFLFAIKVADQWQKAAVLRLGRYIGLRGLGMFFIIPVVDSISQYVDQRVRVTDVKAESALTRDTVPVNVDAIIFWLVWDAEKCILEVQDFQQAITLSAQTALRESIGRHELAQMITEREMLGKELQRILDEKTNLRGITVQIGGDSRRAHSAGARGCHVAGRRRPSVNGQARYHSGDASRPRYPANSRRLP